LIELYIRAFQGTIAAMSVHKYVAKAHRLTISNATKWTQSFDPAWLASFRLSYSLMRSQAMTIFGPEILSHDLLHWDH